MGKVDINGKKISKQKHYSSPPCQLSEHLSSISKLSQLGMHLGNVAAKFI